MKTREVIPWGDTNYPWRITERHKHYPCVGVLCPGKWKTEEEAKAALKRLEEKEAERKKRRSDYKARADRAESLAADWERRFRKLAKAQSGQGRCTMLPFCPPNADDTCLSYPTADFDIPATVKKDVCLAHILAWTDAKEAEGDR